MASFLDSSEDVVPETPPGPGGNGFGRTPMSAWRTKRPELEGSDADDEVN